MAPDPATEAGVPSDNTTLSAVLDDFAAQGWSGQAEAVEGGQVRWPACGHQAAASDLEVVRMRRMEGASDPADMLAVVAVACPTCGQRGVLVAHYGPMADAADADVLVDLPR